MPLQRAFRGLQNFVGQYTGGQLEFEFGNVITPTLDLDDWIKPKSIAFVADLTLAFDGFIEIEVPINRFWRLNWASCGNFPSAAFNCNLLIALVRDLGGVGRFITMQPRNPITTAEFDCIAGRFGGYGLDLKGLNAEPGDRIRLKVQDQSAAGTNNIQLYLTFQEIDI